MLEISRWKSPDCWQQRPRRTTKRTAEQVASTTTRSDAFERAYVVIAGDVKNEELIGGRGSSLRCCV